jgi:Trk K+ transport system NAD-binding subunit/Kef-type K+ transport system membrane component KefB
MENLSNLLIFVASFAVVALASKQIGGFFARIKLPLISGFLFAGVIAGPYVLDLIPTEAIEKLRFIDEVSLAFIAFAAGSELYIKELKSRFKSIAWVTAGNAVVIPVLGGLTLFLLADFIPFMREMAVSGRIAVSMLAGAILVARSPSSAIAIVNELRAKGPFTQTVLGVTMITDVVVIFLFAFSSSVADTLLTNLSFDVGFIALLIGELLLSLLLGYALGKILQIILSLRSHSFVKAALILLVGYGVFVLSAFIRDVSHTQLPFEIFLEPLLICMIGGFVVTNYSDYRDEFLKISHDIGPPIYIAFFTLTGASLALDVLAQTWVIALALFAIRLGGIFIGSFGGGMLAGDPAQHNRIGWLTYVTQAGVGLGLAKEVADEFPAWGGDFATMIISVIVLNQIIGPLFFKYAINRVGEAHPRGETAPFDGVRDVIIFGLRAQAVTLARQLQRHDWQVKLVCRSKERMDELAAPDVNIHLVDDLSLATLQKLDAEHADTIVSFLSDEESYQVCELAYEHFGIETIVVRLRDRANFDRFHKLGVMVVEPQTAVVSLLEHFVRSPAGTSLLLGMDEGQEVIDLEVRDPRLHGVALRDLRLPLDVLILSIHRNGHTLVSRGHTQLHLGDKVTMVGPEDKLDEVMLRFDA